MLEALKPSESLRPDFLFLDIEASGLHKTSFPISVGIADDCLTTRSWLIKPARGWELLDWSFEAEKVHGLSWDDLQIKGSPVQVVAREVQEALAGRVVFATSAWDQTWLWRLFDAAGLPKAPTLVDAGDALPLYRRDRPSFSVCPEPEMRAARAIVDRLFPHSHRADADALRLAARFRSSVDASFRSALLRTHGGVDETPTSPASLQI